MTQFGLTVWVYQLTGEATALALVALFGFAPSVLVGPFAGALVDRWNRKLVMMISDVAAGLATVAVFLLHRAGTLEIWHIYAAAAFSGTFAAFQWPAYSAAISTMLKKAQYGRANGMMGLAEALSGVLGAPFAAALLVIIDLGGILLIDIMTFVFAVGMLLLVNVPQPKVSATGAASRGNLLQEAAFGFRYIWSRKGLLGVQMAFFFANLTANLGMTIVAAMLLARSGEGALATTQSIGALGGVIGGLLMSAWGGPKHRVRGVLGGMILNGLFWQALMGVGQTVLVWSVASFIGGVTLALTNASNQALWQSKVPPDVQGKVFAARRLIAQVAAPAAMALAGILADRVFEPAMLPDGALYPLFSGIVGVGKGSGMAVMFVVFGLIGALISAGFFGIRAVRQVDTLMPDHDADAAAPTPAAAAAPAG
jgi:hypothetical protein